MDALFEKGGPKAAKGAFRGLNHGLECADNRRAYQGLSLSESYREGRLKIRFPVEVFERRAVIERDKEIPYANDAEVRRSSDLLRHQRLKLCNG